MLASVLPAAVQGLAAEPVAPAVETVFIREHKDSSGRAWQRVAIGGLADGDGYFARAIGQGSGIEGLVDDAGSDLWTFTDADLGQIHGQARIALSNVDDGRGGGEWIAVFGGGHGATPGQAWLFVLFIDRGIDGWESGDFVKIPAGIAVQPEQDGQTAASNALGEPALVDTDLNGTADLAYAGDLRGNLYRFELSGRDPSAWRVVRLFQATYGEPTETVQPITQRPFVAMHPGHGEFLVVFGTGSVRAVEGMAPTDIQSIYGIWDPGESDPATAWLDARRLRLVGRVLVNVVDESAGSFETRRMLTGAPFEYARHAPGRTGVYGWYIDLDMPRASQTLQGNPNPDTCGQSPPDPQYPGERLAGRAVPAGRALFMATAIPGTVGGCGDAPAGMVLAVDIATGDGPVGGVFDVNEDGHLDAADLSGVAGETPVSGVMLDGSAFSGTPGEPILVSAKDGSATLTVGQGDDALSLGIGGAAAPRTGRLSWREISEATH